VATSHCNEPYLAYSKYYESRKDIFAGMGLMAADLQPEISSRIYITVVGEE
jgi:hypothetical protein